MCVMRGLGLFCCSSVTLVCFAWLYNAHVVIQQFCAFGKISAFKVTTWSPA